MYNDFLNKHLPGTTKRGLYGYPFDAVWALALGLNASTHLGLEDFTYDNPVMARELMANLLRGKFLGMTGLVTFDSKGGRNSKVIVYQYQGGKQVVVGSYDPITEVLEWSEENTIFFKGGQPPADSIRLITRTVKVQNAVFYTLSVLACIGIIFSAVCFAFNMHYRHTSLVKLSSPRINNIIAAGCCLFFVSIVLIGLDYGHVGGASYVCTVRVWVLVWGFTLTFSSLFAKTWRVHAIFTNKNLKKKIIKDTHLLLIVGFVLLIDVCILLLWAGLDPFRWEVRHLREIYDGNDHSIMYRPEVHVCTSSKMSYWLGGFYAFKALLMVFGIFFAWETRKVKVEALNDSKQIGMCIYNVMIMTVISVVLVNLLPVEEVTVAYVVVAISIMICGFSTLALVFGSKMFTMAQHGHQVDISSARTGTSLAARSSVTRPSKHDSTNRGGSVATANSGCLPSETSKT